MPTVNKEPTSNTTPDPGQGGAAVSGNSNTGHTSTLSSASRTTTGTTSQTKTCLWSVFDLPGGAIQSLTLKFNWSINALTSVTTLISGDSGSAAISFTAGYSINEGADWTTIVNQAISSSGADGSDDSDSLNTSGSISQSIPLGTSIDRVQVRDRVHSTVTVVEDIEGAVVAGANNTVVLSGIHIEVVTQDNQTITMFW